MISKIIFVALETLSAFLLQIGNLTKWTVHRALFEKDDQWYEVRRRPDGHLHPIALHVEQSIVDDKQQIVQFAWQNGNIVQFHLQQLNSHSCSISITLPVSFSAEELQAMLVLLQIELEILKALLENGSTANLPAQHWIHLQNYHVNMYL